MNPLRYAAITTTILLALRPGSASAANLLLNGDFEAGPGKYTGVGLHWETNDASSHPDVDVLTSTTRHSGRWCQFLKANTIWDRGMVRQVSAYNLVSEGKTYDVWAWIRTEHVTNPAGWYVFGISWLNGADQYISDVKMPRQETLNYDWRLIRFSAIAPPGARRVAALLTRHTDGDAWYDDVTITERTAGEPRIDCQPPTLRHVLARGQNPDPDDVTIRNTGTGELIFTVACPADWLRFSPASGAFTPGSRRIDVSYETSALPVGIYRTEMEVESPLAADSPQTVRVEVAIGTPGDMDGDRDVDQEDFGAFQACYTGQGVPQRDDRCRAARLDDDADVDADDFQLLWACLGSPGKPAVPGCGL